MDLKGFIKEQFRELTLPELQSLADLIREVHRLRKGSAHYEEALARSDKEKSELERYLRKKRRKS